MSADQVAMLTAKGQEQVLAELRWYGNVIAGGGPMTGYGKAGRKAEARWYSSTLPLLEALRQVDGDQPNPSLKDEGEITRAKGDVQERARRAAEKIVSANLAYKDDPIVLMDIAKIIAEELEK